MSVAIPVIDYIDPDTRRIYLLPGVTEYHAIDDIYFEVRNLRRTDESLRKWESFVESGGNVQKTPTTFTPRYLVMRTDDRAITTKIVPDITVSHSLLVSGEQISDQGTSGAELIDKTLLPGGINVDVTLQPPGAEIIRLDNLLVESSLFANTVCINVPNGYTGTGYHNEIPIGTRQAPSNNIIDGHAIADERGINTFSIMKSMTISGEDFLSHAHKFIGDSSVAVTVTVDASAEVSLCEFSEMGIQGVLDSSNVLRDCRVFDVTYFNGSMQDCLFSGTVTLDGAVDAVITGGSGSLYVDMGTSGQSLDVYNHSGLVTITNKSGSSDTVVINMNGGEVVIEPTVTSGVIKTSGNGKLVHTQTGDEIVINSMVSGAEIANLQRIVELQGPHHTATGEVWYWDPHNGDDTAEGDHISTAVKTFAQAQSLAASNNHDLIIALPGNPSGVTNTTENIVITKNYLFLRGPGRDFNIKSANDLLNAISITGEGVEVSGLSAANNSTSLMDAVYCTGNFSYLHNLWVADSGNGIHIRNSEYSIVENVKMHHNNGYGLKLSGTSKHSDIIDCHIGSNQSDNMIIDLDAGTHEVNIKGDTVIHSSVAGYGINISATSNGVIISDDVTVFSNSVGDINDLSSTTYNQADHTFTDSDRVLLEDVHGQVARELWFDSAVAVDGNGYQQTPYKVLNNLIDDAEANRITSINSYSDVTLSRDLKNVKFKGSGFPTFDAAGYDLKGMEFWHLQFEGTSTSPFIIQQCRILQGAGLYGHSELCTFYGDVHLTGDTDIINGISGKGGSGYISIDTNGFGLQVTDWHRSLGISNMTSGIHTIEMYGGQLHLDIGCTGGTIYLRGNYSLPPSNLGSTTIIDQTDSKKIRDLHQFKGADIDNPITRGGDGVTNETLTVDGKVLTITPTTITRT